MNSTFSVTVPYELGALKRVKEMIDGMIDDLDELTPSHIIEDTPRASMQPTVPPVEVTDPELVDQKGVFWDERIHSSGKSLLKDGSWKPKRGVSPELKAQVEAEQVKPVNGPAAVFTAPQPPKPEGQVLSSITTFAELAATVTEKNLNFADVNRVVNENGVAGFALLGTASAEVIQKIATDLGL